MSVFKPRGSTLYVYDFQFRGRRFHGPTGCSEKRAAEAVERAEREKAKLAASAPPAQAVMTLDMACGLYWQEVGQHHPRPDQTDRALAWLIEKLGADTPLASITNAEVARIVAIRRGEHRVNRAAETVTRHHRRRRPRKPPKLVSASTVNRSCTEPLRKVLNRARDVWEVPGLKRIAWKLHILPEPQERVRSASVDEEARLFDALPEKYHPAARVALTLGLRISEVTGLRWEQVDWAARQIIVHGKGGRVAPVPMPASIRDLLWGLDRDRRTVFGITTSALDTAYGKALARAGIEGLRFHDLRHTAATRLLAKGGSLKAVQKLLRHTDISTSARYAHFEERDLRELLERNDAEKEPTSDSRRPAALRRDGS
jgi:integrase